MVPEEAQVLQLSFCAAPSLKIWEYVSWDEEGECSAALHLCKSICWVGCVLLLLPSNAIL